MTGVQTCALPISGLHYGYDEEVFVYQHPEYMLNIIKTKPKKVEQEDKENYMISYIEFVATAGEMVGAIDRFCKNNGIRNPYYTSSIFISRLKNELHILNKGGWKTVTREGFEPHFKRVKGNHFWKLRKTYIEPM